MDAIEFLTTIKRVCAANECTDGCPLKDFCDCSYSYQTKESMEKAVAVAEEWAETHPIKTRLSEYKKLFPDCRLTHSGYPNIDPCVVSARYDNVECSEMTDCNKCKKEFWLEEIE